MHKVQLDYGVNLVGRIHESLSRQTTREHIAELDAAREGAADRSAYAQLTRQADSARGALAVRNALTVLTVPLDAVFGSQRKRPENEGREAGCSNNMEMYAEHPCDMGAASWATAGAGICVTVPTAVGGMAAGALLGTLVGQPGRGMALGALPLVPVGFLVMAFRVAFAEATALPSAAIKAAGSGIGGGAGFLYGLVHGPLAARRLANT